MVPAGPLMKEHQLIGRIVPLLTKELARMNAGGELNSELIVSIVDFFRTYADKCHHGKEEDILFRALASKPLSDDHRQTMDQLTEEHISGRKLVGRLLLDRDSCAKGKKAAVAALKEDIRELIEFYPRHIDLEDNHFFLPCMEYLNLAEQAAMLKDFKEFDAKIIHEKYQGVIEDLETAQEVRGRKGR